MTKILFVCHGNVCRSPMAEFVMKGLVKKLGLESQFHIEPSFLREMGLVPGGHICPL